MLITTYTDQLLPLHYLLITVHQTSKQKALPQTNPRSPSAEATKPPLHVIPTDLSFFSPASLYWRPCRCSAPMRNNAAPVLPKKPSFGALGSLGDSHRRNMPARLVRPFPRFLLYTSQPIPSCPLHQAARFFYIKPPWKSARSACKILDLHQKACVPESSVWYGSTLAAFC